MKKYLQKKLKELVFGKPIKGEVLPEKPTFRVIIPDEYKPNPDINEINIWFNHISL